MNLLAKIIHFGSAKWQNSSRGNGRFIAGFLLAAFQPVAGGTSVTMQLDWIYNAQFAGLYQASEQGFFEAAGLDVTIRAVDPKQQTVASVLSGELIFGSAESNILLTAHAAGEPVKVLATMFQDSPMGWMYRKSNGIASFGDLAGKKIGIHPDGEKVIRLAAERLSLPLEAFTLPHVGYDIAVLLNGEVDAMQAYSIDEYVKLKLAIGEDAGIFMAKDYGYSAYSQVIFTTADTVEAHPETVKAFLNAVQLGWEYALDHKEATVDLILEKYNPELDRDYQLASLQEIDKLVRPGGQPALSPINPEVFINSMKRFLKEGILAEPVEMDALLELQYNPVDPQ